jgi:hypothetical protein
MLGVRDMTKLEWLGIAVGVLVVGAGAAPAKAEVGGDAALAVGRGGSRVAVSADSLARSDRQGAMLVLGVSERWDSADGEAPVLRDRYVALGLSAGVNQDYLQGTASLDWAPLSVLTLGTRYDVFDFMANDREGVAHRLLFAPALHLALGPVTLQNQVEVAHYRFTGAMEGQTFHEWDHDLTVAAGNWLVVSRSGLLVDLWRGDAGGGLRVGPGYEVARQGAAHLTRQRAIVTFQFAPAEDWGVFGGLRLQATGGVDLAPGHLRGERFVSGGLGLDLDVL